MRNTKDNYFDLRGIDHSFYKNSKLPKSIIDVLPINKNCSILDIGCGLGQNLLALKKLGFSNLTGIDISIKAVEHCKKNGLNVSLINNIKDLAIEKKYDFIIMSHILEHIERNEIINTLKHIRNNYLSKNGKLYLAVPNAQSNTGVYWYFEDFTHHYLFTTGSLLYVLKAAGFTNIRFLDSYHISERSLIKRIIKKTLLNIYIANKKFWNKVTSSSFHKPSPLIFSFELICIVSD